MTRDFLTMRDGKEISIIIWEECFPVNGSVVIIHGMAEHIERYDDFAKFLNSKGYAVIGMDLRAHGDTDPDTLGVGKNLFEMTVGDIAEMVAFTKKRYRMMPFLMGHSYGSFLTQRFMQKHCSEVKGVILSGSALMGGAKLKLAKLLAGNAAKKAPDEKGMLFANMTFKSYDKKLGSEQNAWLTYDAEKVKKYNEDSKCGYICSNAFYQSFFNGLADIEINNKSFIFPKNYNILIASGSEDGVGGYGKLSNKLFKKLNSMGASAVYKCYPKMRHEILNEIDCNLVFNDFYEFMEKITNAK